MKKIYIDVLLILGFFLTLLVRDVISFKSNKTVINTVYSLELQNVFNRYNKLEKYDSVYSSLDNYIIAKLKYRDISSFEKYIILNKGRNDNVKENMIVLSTDGVLGIIDKVYSNTTRVKLLTNSDIKLSVKVNNSYGILKSLKGKIFIKNIVGNDDIKIGDKIYTSGLTGIISNYYIGEVKNIKQLDLGLEREVEVKLASDFSNIDYVVLLGD